MSPSSSSSSSSDKTGVGQETVTTLLEVIQMQDELEVEAAEVLPFDITKCSRSLGHLKQSVYSCLTCNPPIDGDEPLDLGLELDRSDNHQQQRQRQQHTRAGLCSSCSVSCHTDHRLVELFLRRDFRCDCGTERCNPRQCQLVDASDSFLLDHNNNSSEDDGDHHETSNNSPTTTTSNTSSKKKKKKKKNKYDKNFDGQFCICERGKRYDPQTETEDMYQCLACEDWRHRSCLGPHPDPDDWEDLICADCVQNDPRIRSILFKHAGGEGIGMIVCATTSSGPSGPDGGSDRVMINYYGKLTQSESDLKLPDSNPHNKESSSPSSSSSSDRSNRPTSQQPHTPTPAPLDDSMGPMPGSHIPVVVRGKQPERLKDGREEPIERGSESVDNPPAGANKRRLDDDDRPVEVTTSSCAAKRTRCDDDGTPSEGNDDKNDDQYGSSWVTTTEKKERVTTTSSTECRAPFQDLDRSILGSSCSSRSRSDDDNRTIIDPRFSNVYLVAGWRDRWCRCPDCDRSLRRLSWLIEEEEVWEPADDSDSLKSLHELGLEALKSLPRDQLVNGLLGYNKLKEEFLEFLKPFEANDVLVTERDIQRFFLDTKSKILQHHHHHQSW